MQSEETIVINYDGDEYTAELQTEKHFDPQNNIITNASNDIEQISDEFITERNENGFIYHNPIHTPILYIESKTGKVFYLQ